MFNRAWRVCGIAKGLVIGLSLWVAPSFAYELSPELKKGAQELMALAQEDDTAYQIIESLTTEVGPRLAGSPAEKRARTWAQQKFKSLGFKRVRIEGFDVPYWRRLYERAEVLSPYPQPLVVTALGGSVATPKNGVEGEVVRFANLEALKAAKANSLKRKLVFVDDIMVRAQDGSGYGVAVAKRREVAFEAARVGAQAALIRSVGTSKHRFAHTGQMKSFQEIKAGATVPAASLSAPDADQLARMLKSNKTVRVKLNLHTEIQEQSRSGNVIGEIPGKAQGEQIVLLGAHLDSWDLGTGAVDDGAGVGIVMAAAHLLKQYMGKQAPQRSVRIVLFGAEEVGLVGAKAYTEKYREQLAQHVIIGESDFGAENIWRMGSANVSEAKLPLFKAIQKLLQPLNIIPGNNQSYGGPDLSFMKAAGVPTLDMAQIGSDYFDLHHTADDTFNKINRYRIRQNVAAYAAFLYVVANMEEDFR